MTIICSTFLYSYGIHRDLHSFPTRRSSDLNIPSLRMINAAREILKSDESCISNPRSEISNWTVKREVQFEISDLRLFEMQDSSFTFLSSAPLPLRQHERPGE